MDPDSSPPADRPLGRALARGASGRCPVCGEGKLFSSFLKPVPHCGSCRQSWEAQRADDLPAYIVVLLLGHLIVPLMIEVNAAFDVSMAVQAVLWPGLAAVLAILLIQPVKGAVIALQWSRRLHGFGAAD
jgi:uncharacterized protein (DUF983 family)